jgi:hypothetical protein
MISSSVPNIRQYCSVCKATLDMTVVDTVQDHEVTWLKCPRCNGILPHMMSREEAQEAAAAPAATVTVTVPVASTALVETERASARDYDATQVYAMGDVVYHRSMNQYGRVVEKTMLPGRRAAVKLQFESGDTMTLREAGA